MATRLEQLKKLYTPPEDVKPVEQPIISSQRMEPNTSTPTGAVYSAPPTIKPITPIKPTLEANDIGTEGLNIPPIPQDTTNYNALIAGAMESRPTTFKTPSGVEVDSRTGAVISQPKTEVTTEGKPPAESQNLYQKLVEQISGGTFGQAPERIDVTQFDEQYQIQQKQQLVNDYTAQLNAINAEAEAEKIGLIGQEGRGIPQSLLNNQQARIERNRAIRALPIAAALSAAQGNLTFAQSQVEKALNVEKDYNDKMYQYKRDQRDAIYEIATTEEKRRIDELNRQDDIKREEQYRLLDLKESIVSEAIKNGQGNLIPQIMEATDESGVYSVAGKLQAPTDIISTTGVSPLTGKVFTEKQSQAGTFATRMSDAEVTFSDLDLLTKATKRGIGGFIPEVFAINRLKSGDRKRFEQAEKNFITAVLRRESGAAISAEEFEDAAKVYIPQPGDDKRVLDLKEQARNTVRQGFINESVGAFQQLQESVGDVDLELKSKARNLGYDYDAMRNDGFSNEDIRNALENK